MDAQHAEQKRKAETRQRESDLRATLRELRVYKLREARAAAEAVDQQQSGSTSTAAPTPLKL